MLAIVAWDFYSACCLRHGKIVYKLQDIKLPVATIVVGFSDIFQKLTTFFVSYRDNRFDLNEAIKVVDFNVVCKSTLGKVNHEVNLDEPIKVVDFNVVCKSTLGKVNHAGCQMEHSPLVSPRACAAARPG